MKWLVTKVGVDPSALAARLRLEGHVVDELTVGRIEPLTVTLPPCDWIVVTSRQAVPALRRQVVLTRSPLPRLAAIGASTAAALQKEGHVVSFVPSQPNGETLKQELAPLLKPTDRVVRLKPRGAADSLADLACVCRYETLDAYENVPVPLSSVDLSSYDAALFTSPSAVTRVLAVAVGRTQCHALGPTTRSALQRAGVVVEASSIDFLKTEKK